MTDTPGKEGLDEIRERIDALDATIQKLISERAMLARDVGGSKAARTIDYYRPEREAQVLRSIVKQNKGPLSDEEMVRLFREIMSACLAQQEPLKVAFLGLASPRDSGGIMRRTGP